MTVPSAFGEKVSSGQKRTAEDMQYQESTSEALPAQSSTTEVPGWKNTLEEAPSQMTNVEEEELCPSGWNFSFEDFKQVFTPVPSTAMTSWWCFHFPTSSLVYPSVSPPKGLFPMCCELETIYDVCHRKSLQLC